MVSKVKTNAMRILDSHEISYKVHSYKVKKGEHIDGVEVANNIGEDVNKVYKTLVAISSSKNIYVYVVPVNAHLDLKKCSKVSNEKNVDMVSVNDINKLTGYIRGGCSPIGMKKLYKTYIHEDAKHLDKIIVSAGKIGYQLEVSPIDLESIINCEFEDLVK